MIEYKTIKYHKFRKNVINQMVVINMDTRNSKIKIYSNSNDIADFLKK
ncbi:hypothetical protein Calow_0306 [Caldicellulosiruptor owensensis OL]|uniref:Uncharacterized protein n=1 Tax=Caldicellulosiruptor owensensis (strain ATCC 700167 / DSM 13100 / OL) TaxID=632518 RepID=E4Q369_CALOW|nr:hypothetical protein Calow_0306 [Caldicellulosiruptor owensensis OL]